MKFSIITTVLNNREHVESCIRSVLNQSYDDIEYLVIDGCSLDGTTEIIDRYRSGIAKFVCEPDDGIYDALNKGIKAATGDVIGILHADDFYEHEKVVESVVKCMETEDVDSCYGNLLYVSKTDTNKIIRFWKSSPYRQGQFRNGWMPPHCTFFAKKWVYEKYGLFRTDFKIAADYELMLRFLEKHRISTYHIDDVLIRMRVGGVSNRRLGNILQKSYEDYRAWKVNGLHGGLSAVFLKNISKLPQLLAYFKHSPLPISRHAQNG